MPFIASKGGRKVIPEGVEDGEAVTCLDCEETMYPRGPSIDGRARHFFHPASSGREGGCGGGGGESDTHRKLKSLAASALRTEFEDEAKQYGVERRLKAPATDEINHRDADAYVEFESRDEQLGRGLIAEVQYRNKGKDIDATTQDYIAQGWSVCWLDVDDFASDRCLLDTNEFRQRATEAVWPEYIPSRFEWGSVETNFYRMRAQWLQSESKTLSEDAAKVRLPPEWNDEAAQQMWASQEWLSLFRAGHARQYIAEVQASLGSAVVTIDSAPWLTADMVVDAYNAGLEQHSTVLAHLPPHEEWTGTLSIDVSPTPPQTRAVFPPEVLESRREELKDIWGEFMREQLHAAFGERE